MHGCGNDYVYVDCTAAPLPHPERAARLLSDRHFGVGADGLILILPSAQADFRMEMYNADGSVGAMCGNGIRCVGKYVYDHGLTRKTALTIETRSGVRALKLTVAGNRVTRVRVDMGAWSAAAADVPVVGLGETVLGVPFPLAGRTWELSCLSLGNPHAVVWCENPDALNLAALGPQLEHSPCFPDRVNAEFVRVLDEHRLALRVWERGAGETLACGTGACAAAVAAHLAGKCGDAVTVTLPGGTLEVALAGGHAFLTGPAETVFTGELDLPGEAAEEGGCA